MIKDPLWDRAISEITAKEMPFFQWQAYHFYSALC